MDQQERRALDTYRNRLSESASLCKNYYNMFRASAAVCGKDEHMAKIYLETANIWREYQMKFEAVLYAVKQSG